MTKVGQEMEAEIPAVLAAKADALVRRSAANLERLSSDAITMDGGEVEQRFRSLGVFRQAEGRWLWIAGLTMPA